jgi:hypothetical protein
VSIGPRSRRGRRRAGPIIVVALVALGGAASAARARVSPPSTFLLSATSTGRLPDGASCCGVVSHDERIGRVMAYESLASNITPGTRRGVSNVFAVLRREPWAADGSPWVAGRTILVSHGPDGKPANGPSYAPAVSGSSAYVPSCVAFISRASNLVAGDRNHAADAFVEDLSSGRITRVSADTRGAEANGDTTEVAVSGDCRRVAFVSDATNLAQTASDPELRGVRTDRPPPDTSQVYMHFLAGALNGVTMLISAHGVHPADANVDQLSMSRDGTAVTYATAAGNLGVASAGVSQVWERSLTVTTPPSGRPTAVAVTSSLVSATAAGGPGNSPSMNPSVDHDGQVIAFATVATNLLAGADGAAQIIRATMTRPAPTLEWVSRSANRPDVGNGPSYDPSITDGGEWIFFDSTAGNIGNLQNQSGEPNENYPGARQVYRWTVPGLATHVDNTHIYIESQGGPYYDAKSRTPAWNEDTSARGNYLTFESEDPGLDPDLPASGEPAWYAGHAAELDFSNWYRPNSPPLTLPQASPSRLLAELPGIYGTADGMPGDPRADPRSHQVYVRFLGSDD